MDMKMHMIIHEYDRFQQDTIQFLYDMLLYDRIRLSELPFSIRTKSGIYCTALRISNGISCHRFVEDLQLLCSDYEKLDEDCSEKTTIIRTLDGRLCINDHKENEVFRNFERNLSEKVLCALLRSRGASEEIIRTELRKQGFIK